MADIITRFKLETTQYDSKLRDAAKGLKEITHLAQLGGKGFTDFSQKAVESARALGNTASGAMNTKEKVRDLVGAFNEAAKAYNSLNQTQQRSDFGKNLAASLETLKGRIAEAKQELYGLGDAMGKSGGGGLFSGLGDKMSGAMQVFAGNMLTKAAGAVASLGQEMYGMVQQGIEMAKAGEGVRIAFERLGRGDILDGLREATHGTVTDLELMKAAVKFNDFKLPVEELGTMLAFAQQKAKDTGQSVDYMVDSIVTGLGRKSLMILDNLGLSAAEIKEKMAETGDMTKAVGAIIREQMAKAGDYVETAADRAAQANVSLQNKMEELGRKFAPLEEASNSLWTSMKIGILDVVGGPLARLLNGLTEAGRLKNMLNDLNGDGSGGKETQTEKALRLLREYSGGKKGVEGKRDLYNRQVASYSKQEESAWREANRLREELKGLRKQQKENGLAGNLSPLIKDTSQQLEAAENRAKALQIMRANYEKGAQSILNPAKVDNDTNGLGGTTTTTHTITPQQRAANSIQQAEQKYQDAVALAAKQFEAGNITEAAYKKQLEQGQQRLYDAYGQAYLTYADPKYKEAQQKAADEIVKLGGEVKTATEAQKAAEKAARQLEQAQKKLADAQREMSEARQSNDLKGQLAAEKKITAAQADIDRLTPKTFAVTADTGDIMERLRDIQGVTIDDKTMTVTAETAEAATALQQVEGITLTPKTFTVTADTGDIMERLRDIMERLRDIQGVTIDDKTMTVIAETAEAATALQQVEGITLTPKTFTVTADTAQAEEGLKKLERLTGDKEITLTATFTEDNMAALMNSVREQIGQTDIGSDLYNKLTEKLRDATALSGLMQVALQNGIDMADLSGISQAMWQKLFKDGDIPDDVLDGLRQQLEEATGKNINIDKQSGKVTEEDNKPFEDFTKGLNTVAGGLSSVTNGMKSLGIEIPKEIDAAINVMNAIGQIIGGVQAIISLTQTPAQVSNTTATGLNTIAIYALIAALKINSTTNVIPFFAGGGIVHAANGWSGVVPGNSYSGDNIPIMANAGEVVLNAAQTNGLAMALEGGGIQDMQLETRVSAEDLIFILNNNASRRGFGRFIDD